MKNDNVREYLVNKITEKAERIIQDKAAIFKSLLKYEIAVANTELAMMSHRHGYDFTFIPDSYANSVTFGSVNKTDSVVSLEIKIPEYVFKDASNSLFEYFKTVIVGNTIIKMRNGI